MEIVRNPPGIQLTVILTIIAGVVLWMLTSSIPDYRYFSVLQDSHSTRTVTCEFTSTASAALNATAICEGACRERGFHVVNSNLDTVVDWAYPQPWHRAEVIAKYVPLACRL